MSKFLQSVAIAVTFAASSAASSAAWAIGACVYTDTRTAARLTICEDGVAHAAACNQRPGVNNKFFPGKTCAQLKAENQSNTNVSMGADLDRALALVDRTGRARMPIRFDGTDIFTDPRLAGTAVTYQGHGTALLTRGPEGLVHVEFNDLAINVLNVRPGDVSPHLAEQMTRYVRDARIPRSLMSGVLRFDRERQAYIIELDQTRVVAARGFMGSIKSRGIGLIPLRSRAFSFQGHGVTLHPLLFGQQEI